MPGGLQIVAIEVVQNPICNMEFETKDAICITDEVIATQGTLPDCASRQGCHKILQFVL